MSHDFKPFLKTINIKDGNNRIPIIVGRASSRKGREITDPHNVYLNEPHISAKHFSFDYGKIINYSNNTTLYMGRVLDYPKVVTKEMSVNKKSQLVCIGFCLNELDIKSMSPEKIIESSRVVLVFYQVAPWRYKVYCSKSEDFLKQFNSFFQQEIEMDRINDFEFTVFLKYLFHMAEVTKIEDADFKDYVSEDDTDYIFSDSNDETESSLELDDDDDEEEEEGEEEEIALKLLRDLYDHKYDVSENNDSDYELESMESEEEEGSSTSFELVDHDKLGNFDDGKDILEDDEEIDSDETVVKEKEHDDIEDVKTCNLQFEENNEDHEDVPQRDTNYTQFAENNDYRKKRSYDEMNSCIANLSDVIIDQQRIIKRQECEIIQLKRSKHIKKVMVGFLSGAVATIGALIQYGKHREC